jgi:cell filamentation protein
MSPDPDQEKSRRERREAALVANRIRELREDPIVGAFDLAHLKAVHRYIFQDLPHHRPGVTRADSANWKKRRGLEGRAELYDVPYRSRGVGKHAAKILKRFGGPATLAGLDVSAAAERLSALYGDLDHAHGFYEGKTLLAILSARLRRVPGVGGEAGAAPAFRSVKAAA